MRAFTKLTIGNGHKRYRNSSTRRHTKQTATNVTAGGQFCVVIDEYKQAKTRSKRLCGFFQESLIEHMQSFLDYKKSKIKNGAKCYWCGEKTYTKCTICGVPLHNLPVKGEHFSKACSLEWHNDGNFGLAYRDAKELPSKAGVNWTMPSRAA